NYYAYFFLADSLAITGKYEDALINYKKALDIYPFSADAVYNTGVIYYIRGEFNEAAIWLAKAVDLYPDFSGARLYLAKSFIAMGKDQKAAEQLAAAEKASPGIILEDSSKNIKAFFEETSGF
ncbi:MAG TPA: tetratricopeptide repeat protein, partial [Candidatus Goldiibacteriota bacterium]|nr:tetratricopeptide repeat protein [Candidatus Goldiibacteriota bacterium]